jgi:hypothetical protein
MTKTLLAATALAGVLASTPAPAATFSASPLDCKDQPGCFKLVIEGDILMKDDQKFADLIKEKNVKMAVVKLDSPGGMFIPGHAIGKIIRERGYSTYVGENGECASVCALMWLAGSTRQYSAKAKIGFHGAYLMDKRGNILGASSRANALIGGFYARLGLSDEAIMQMTSASANDIWWLTADSAKKYDVKATLIKETDDTFTVGPWPSGDERPHVANPEKPAPVADPDK